MVDLVFLSISLGPVRKVYQHYDNQSDRFLPFISIDLYYTGMIGSRMKFIKQKIIQMVPPIIRCI